MLHEGLPKVNEKKSPKMNEREQKIGNDAKTGERRRKWTCIDMIGKKFGSLTVVGRAGSTRFGCALWRCRCSCGIRSCRKETIVKGSNLRSGFTRSCGCNVGHGKTHGRIGERLYGVWSEMRQRCLNPNNKNYSYYGGRGITVCAEWDDYAKFREWALANGYNPVSPRGQCTIDRINNDGIYEPSNCRWIDTKTQNANRNFTRELT